VCQTRPAPITLKFIYFHRLMSNHHLTASRDRDNRIWIVSAVEPLRRQEDRHEPTDLLLVVAVGAGAGIALAQSPSTTTSSRPSRPPRRPPRADTTHIQRNISRTGCSPKAPRPPTRTKTEPPPPIQDHDRHAPYLRPRRPSSSARAWMTYDRRRHPLLNCLFDRVIQTFR